MALDISRIFNDILGQLTPFLEKTNMQRERQAWLNNMYQKDLEEAKGRNAIELQKTSDTGTLARQRLINQGASDVAGIQGKSALGVADTNAGAHIFGLREGRKADEYKADKELEWRKGYNEAVVDASQGRVGEKFVTEAVKNGMSADQVAKLKKKLFEKSGEETGLDVNKITTNDVQTFNSPNPTRASVNGGKSMSFAMDNPMGVKKIKTSRDYLGF